MNFGSLRDAAINFANFLVGHLFWFSLTIVSLYFAFDQTFVAWASAFANVANGAYQDPQVANIIRDYNLKPVIPALCVFAAVFVLHANVEVARRIGHYVPPSFQIDPQAGFRSVFASSWRTFLRHSKIEISFESAREIAYGKFFTLLEAEDSKEHRARSRSVLFTAYNLFKFYLALNLVLLVVVLLTTGIFSFRSLALATGLAACALLTAFIRAFHDLLIYDHLAWQSLDELSRHEDVVTVPPVRRSDEDLENIEADAVRWRKVIRSRQIIRFGWDIPLFGSVGLVAYRLGKLRTLQQDEEEEFRLRKGRPARVRPWSIVRLQGKQPPMS